MSQTLTALFVVTGGWALVRLAQVATGRAPSVAVPAVDVVAELSHLVMSVAMIAMVRGVVAGPTGPGGVATLVVFGLLTAWACARLVRGTTRHRPTSTAHHLLMSVGMLWMVAAMPEIMGVTDQDMAGMPGMTPVHDAGPSPWITALTWMLVVMLVAAAALWVLRATRTPAAPEPAPADPPHGGVAVLTPVAVPNRTATLIARVDASCHALMSLGMAGMIVAMF